MKKKTGLSFAMSQGYLFLSVLGGLLKKNLAQLIFLLICNSAAAQTCYVIKSIPSTPPTGPPDTLISATDYRYGTLPTRIYSSWALDGVGTYTEIPTSNPFWFPGVLNRCGVWGQSHPKTLAFSVCVNIPADKVYYMGFASDNAGTVIIDGVPVLGLVEWNFWGIYPIPLTKGIHFAGFSVDNFDIATPASIGFEIYDNTKQEIINASGYYKLNLIYSTKNELGKIAQAGDPASTYSCPVGYLSDFCSTTTSAPVCSQFVPIEFVITNPTPACISDGADITLPQITAGSSTSLTYTYWADSLATIPLANPNKITKSGTYYIMGSYNDCNIIKPVAVIVNSISTVINKTICPGDTYMGYKESGTYTNTLKAASGCDSVVTLNLTLSPKVNLGPDKSICAGDSILLNPGAFSQYLWQDNTTTPSYTVKAPGTYWVTVIDQNGCMTSDTVIVKFGGCFDSKIPNTFTPNGDGINDVWNINGLQDFPQCTVFIYSRWGQLIFRSTGYAKAFDGTYDGKKLAVGTYYYIINLGGALPQLSGFVTLIR
jgi:gliding motility-associated-like protein